jgi:predicted NUDIX family NTP pyrophosphohydrolase
MEQSAGTLLYRITDNGIEVLLVHPSGNFNRRAPWSIPKGIPDGEESLEAAARRETYEETGIMADKLFSLSSIDYRSGRKRVHCFAGPVPADTAPHCASWEVDRAEFLPINDARRFVHPDQVPFLDRLEAHLRQGRSKRGHPPSG